MGEYLLEVQRQLENPKVRAEDDKKAPEKNSESIATLKRELSLLRNLQVNQCRTSSQNLDPCIQKYTKNLSSLNLFKKELKKRMLLYTDEIAATESETTKIKTSNEIKVATLNRLISEAKDNLKVMLEEKVRHERALEVVKEEAKSKYEDFKRLEIEKFHDAESIYSYKKLSLLKKLKALDADIEVIAGETSLAQKRMSDLKITNRELRSKYYKLMRP